MTKQTIPATTATKRKRHKWEPPKRETWATFRLCKTCSLEKVTDHNDRFPRTYYRYVVGEFLEEMPECEIVT